MSRWMQTAWAQVGTAEVAGPQANPRIVEYFAHIGRADVVSDEVAWCGGFAGYCLATSSVPLDAIPPSERLLAMSYKKIGTPIDDVRPGALVILTRPEGGPGAGHVGFVAGVTPTHVLVLGGNQSNTVNVTPFRRERIVALRWPDAAATPADVEKTSRIAQASGQQVRDGTKAGGAQITQSLPPDLPGLDQITGWMGKTQGATETVLGFAQFAWGKLPLVAALAGGYWLARMAWNAWQIRQWRTADHNTGKTDAPVMTEPAIEGEGA